MEGYSVADCFSEAQMSYWSAPCAFPMSVHMPDHPGYYDAAARMWLTADFCICRWPVADHFWLIRSSKALPGLP